MVEPHRGQVRRAAAVARRHDGDVRVELHGAEQLHEQGRFVLAVAAEVLDHLGSCRGYCAHSFRLGGRP